MRKSDVVFQSPCGGRGGKPVLAVLLLLGLTACQSVPREAALAGVALPTQWHGAEGGAVLAHWLEAFGDATLTAWVQAALADNFSLQAAAARVDAARAQVRVDGAARWPQLEFAAGYQRSQVRDAGYGQAEFGAFEALFELNWELDVWGRLRALRQAAAAEADASAADFHAARLSLAARTAQTYFELAEARLQTAVAEQSIHDRRTIAELVRGRFVLGLGRALDLRLALTDLANAEAQLADAHNQMQASARRLETLLGRYPAAALTVAPALPAPPTTLPAGLPAELLQRRPDVQAAAARLDAAAAQLEAAQQARLPRIALTAAGGTRSAALVDMLDPRAAAWNLASGLAQPLFNGGRIRAEVERRHAQHQQALALYRDTVLNAFREVEQALAAEAQLRQQQQALAEAVRQTEESRKLAVYDYRQGLIEILTLLDSYRSTLNAQSAHLTVQRQLLNNRISLYLALGGGV